MTITDIKTLLRISDSSEDVILNLLLDNAINCVLLYLNADELPPQVEFIVTEMVVARYNVMQVEGMTTTNNTGVAYTFSKEDLFPYMNILNLYIASGRKVVFL
jgi:hypothetical protein